jgi:hypothetical protein
MTKVFSQIEHLIKMANDVLSKWNGFFCQVWHLVKMANDF